MMMIIIIIISWLLSDHDLLLNSPLDRDFNVRNGRPVTTHDDILPVASEYQRYKVGSWIHLLFLLSLDLF